VILLRGAAAGEGVRADLFVDLLRVVRHEHGRVLVGRRHLGVGALERREELGVEEARFLVPELVGGIASEQELGLGWSAGSYGSVIWINARMSGRTYGSWSIAQGMRAGMSSRWPKMWGKELEKDGVAWMDAKWNMPTLSLRRQSIFPRTAAITIQRRGEGEACGLV
jgi:hypothetical protein